MIYLRSGWCILGSAVNDSPAARTYGWWWYCNTSSTVAIVVVIAETITTCSFFILTWILPLLTVIVAPYAAMALEARISSSSRSVEPAAVDWHRRELHVDAINQAEKIPRRKFNADILLLMTHRVTPPVYYMVLLYFYWWTSVTWAMGERSRPRQ